ncbi:hypothetical protein CXG81DRAFT_21501 [Caulochytrium protostelioides]|uniref:Uncharacterized protein n=1 Tax=Caulochytrium protostelioides TaxID=1555241 RepID=A0A4P9WXP2_9FUNG|nr:hypothetical protein CXG81DRAFT_21501 [Caulochytrium protostelioides]|eukprot:RKO98249.1 hypothetical protein CXG81DRAFT_21501 [Caulochytrium protostelioides]
MLMAIRGGHGLLPVLLLAFLMSLAVIAAPTEPDSNNIQESNSPSGGAVRTTVGEHASLGKPGTTKRPRRLVSQTPSKRLRYEEQILNLLPSKKMGDQWKKLSGEVLGVSYPLRTIDAVAEWILFPFRAANLPNAVNKINLSTPRIVLFLNWWRQLKNPPPAELGSPSELTIQVGTGDNVSNWSLQQAVHQLDNYANMILKVYAAWSKVLTPGGLTKQDLDALNRNTLFKGIILTFLRLRQDHNVVVNRKTEETMTTVMANLQDDLINAHGVIRENPGIADSWPFLLTSMRDHAESMGSVLAQTAPPKYTEVSGKQPKQLQRLADKRNSKIRDIGKQFAYLLNFLDESAGGRAEDFDAQIAVYSLARSVFEWKVRYSDYGEPDKSESINKELVNHLPSSQALGSEVIFRTLQQAVEINFGPKWSDITADKTELLANLDDAIKDFNSFMGEMEPLFQHPERLPIRTIKGFPLNSELFNRASFHCAYDSLLPEFELLAEKNRRLKDQQREIAAAKTVAEQHRQADLLTADAAGQRVTESKPLAKFHLPSVRNV